MAPPSSSSGAPRGVPAGASRRPGGVGRTSTAKKALRRRLRAAVSLAVLAALLSRNPFWDAALARWPRTDVEDGFDLPPRLEGRRQRGDSGGNVTWNGGGDVIAIGTSNRNDNNNSRIDGNDNYHGYRNASIGDIDVSGGGECGRILLYITDMITPTTGLGHRTGRFLLATILAALTDAALVVLDPPPDEIQARRRWDDVGGSPYGCPRRAGGRKCDDLPTGLGRVVEVPRWLSRGCAVPCAETISYEDWFKIADGTREKSGFAPTVCSEGSGTEATRNVTVLALGKYLINHYWVLRARKSLVRRDVGLADFDRTDPDWAGWVARFSQRMGASQAEIARFVEGGGTNESEAIAPLNYLGALLDRTGGIRYQSWILQDVAKILREIDGLPMSRVHSFTPSRLLGAPSADVSSGYDAVHVRRGDRVGTVENAKAVSAYWSERGYPAANFTWDNKKNEEILSELYPTKYIPFSHYWLRYNSSGCPDYRSRNATVEGARRIYIATDDAEAVRAEIANLTSSHGEGYWTRCGERTEFVFNPRERYAKHIHLKKQTAAQRQGNAESDDEGYEQYLRTVSAIADLHVLSQSDIFVGELQSFWGRLLRTLRTSFRRDVPFTKDVLIAWGSIGMTPPW